MISVGLGILLSSLISAAAGVGSSAINSSAQKKATEEANRTNNLNNTLDVINNKQSLINNSGVNNIMGERINQFRCGGKKYNSGGKDDLQGIINFVDEEINNHNLQVNNREKNRMIARTIRNGNPYDYQARSLNSLYYLLTNKYIKPNVNYDIDKARENYIKQRQLENDLFFRNKDIIPFSNMQQELDSLKTINYSNKKCGGKTKLKHKVNGGQDRQEKVDFMDRISFYKRNR